MGCSQKTLKLKISDLMYHITKNGQRILQIAIICKLMSLYILISVQTPYAHIIRFPQLSTVIMLSGKRGDV